MAEKVKELTNYWKDEALISFKLSQKNYSQINGYLRHCFSGIWRLRRL